MPRIETQTRKLMKLAGLKSPRRSKEVALKMVGTLRCGVTTICVVKRLDMLKREQHH
uniref:Uncharacterized protein n=1 Tax=Arundo donax TaxID=35708 RepID=A0A0A9CIV8_ARUDO